MGSISTTSGSDVDEQPRTLNSMSVAKLDDIMLKQHLEKEMKTKSAVSLLQEFVQCSKDFRLPTRQPILVWHYETRMRDHSTLEFQARALFLLGGALHHAVGTWQCSKKLAQRDAAERAVGFFLGHWCDLLQAEEDSLSQGAPAPGGAADMCAHEMHVLERYAKRFQDSDDTNRWHVLHENNQWQAFLEMDIAGVPHKFGGPKCVDQMEAYRQTAKRTLWYLQHPDYALAFEPDVEAMPAAMSAEPPRWTRDQAAKESEQVVQRKTAMMRLQNRLQQRLGHDLHPGQGVWDWTYETDGKCWPPNVRATVRLAVFNKQFIGDWVRSHRGSQLDTCTQVERFLDQLDKKC